jgi:hypothetical protein
MCLAKEGRLPNSLRIEVLETNPENTFLLRKWLNKNEMAGAILLTYCEETVKYPQ